MKKEKNLKNKIQTLRKRKMIRGEKKVMFQIPKNIPVKMNIEKEQEKKIENQKKKKK